MPASAADNSSSASTVPLWTGDELAQATGGRWLTAGGRSVRAYNISYYLSQARRGDVFIITSKSRWGRGYTDNAHCLKELPSRGVAAAIVDSVPDVMPGDLPVLLVENTRNALDGLGKYARQRIKGKVVCVTGSSGKSTTKEALRFVLAHQGKTAASRLNFNHDEGVPLSLAQTPADAAYGVYEYAADPPQPATHPPKYLIAMPHVAIVTLIAADHLMSYKTLEGVARQKAMLFEGVVAGGCAILNRDDQFFQYLSAAARGCGIRRIIGFGTHQEADVRARSWEMRSDGSRVQATVGGVDVVYQLSQPGHHMIMNSLAVLAAVHALGADVIRAAADLDRYPGLPQHTERHRVSVAGGYFELIDDTFSTNPASIEAGLAVLKLMEPSVQGRRIAVLGAIKELGDSSAQLHRALAPAVLEAGVERLFTIGDDMRYLREVLPARILGMHGEDGDMLAAAVAQEVRVGDVVLVKGSLRSRRSTVPVVKALFGLAPEHS